MIAAAPVLAPAAGGAALTGALLALLLVWVVLYGLQAGYGYSFGALLRVLADATRDIRWIGGKIAATFEAIDSRIQEAIGDGIQSVETATARTWDALTWVVRETGNALVAFGADVHDAIAGLIDAEIPAQVDAKTRPVTDRLSRTNAATDARLRAEALARSRGIDETNRDLTREALARKRGIDAINTRLGAIVLPRIRALDQVLADLTGFVRRNLATRTRHLEQALAAGVIGAVALAAVTRVFPYWQCTNVRRFNRSLCRLPIGLLDDLLGAGLAVLVMSDICRVASLMREAAEFALPAMRGLVAVVDAASECTSFPRPSALPLAVTPLPTSENLVAL